MEKGKAKETEKARDEPRHDRVVCIFCNKMNIDTKWDISPKQPQNHTCKITRHKAYIENSPRSRKIFIVIRGGLLFAVTGWLGFNEARLGWSGCAGG